MRAATCPAQGPFILRRLQSVQRPRHPPAALCWLAGGVGRGLFVHLVSTQILHIPHLQLFMNNKEEGRLTSCNWSSFKPGEHRAWARFSGCARMLRKGLFACKGLKKHLLHGIKSQSYITANITAPLTGMFIKSQAKCWALDILSSDPLNTSFFFSCLLSSLPTSNLLSSFTLEERK